MKITIRIENENNHTAIICQGENTFWMFVKQCHHRWRFAKCERVFTKHK